MIYCGENVLLCLRNQQGSMEDALEGLGRKEAGGHGGCLGPPRHPCAATDTVTSHWRRAADLPAFWACVFVQVWFPDPGLLLHL